MVAPAGDIDPIAARGGDVQADDADVAAAQLHSQANSQKHSRESQWVGGGRGGGTSCMPCRDSEWLYRW